MSKGRCIVSCCFSEHKGERKNYYKKFSDRLRGSLDEFCSKDTSKMFWENSWPPESPSHSQMHYAFKWYAMNAARNAGYRYVMWLDAGSCAKAPIEPFWKFIETNGHLIMAGSVPLGHWISDKALEYFEVDREFAMGLRLPAGCIVGLDFEHPTAIKFFQWWEELVKDTNLLMCSHTKAAEEAGVLKSILVRDGNESEIISTDPRVMGHRSDEACFSLIMNKLGMQFMDYGEWRNYMYTYEIRDN